MNSLDIHQSYKTQYCIPIWLRDQQISYAIKRISKRIAPSDKRDDAMAVVCFGPSLNDTWEKVREFRHIITGSGSHKFLVDKGFSPEQFDSWTHCEVDPREHKVKLIGTPQKGVRYLISSTCHKAVFDHLEGMDVALWHVFDNSEEAIRVLPKGEWALLGGSNIGLRQLAIARFLGFTNLHVFGMDGCLGNSGLHAAEHPNQPKKTQSVEINGKTFQTTQAYLECAKQTSHELNQLHDVDAKFYGEGLVQEWMKDYVRVAAPTKSIIAFQNPETISAEYVQLNRRLHEENPAYGVGGEKHAGTVLQLCDQFKTKNVLDYGAGKRRLGKAIPFQIAEYDPAVPEIAEAPKPADIVVCTDVLEHIEPDKLPYVLADLKRCVRICGYFVIHTGPSSKVLADGRNTHLIQNGKEWWCMKLKKFFTVSRKSIIERGPLLYCIVAPKVKEQKAA